MREKLGIAYCSTKTVSRFMLPTWVGLSLLSALNRSDLASAHNFGTVSSPRNRSVWLREVKARNGVVACTDESSSLADEDRLLLQAAGQGQLELAPFQLVGVGNDDVVVLEEQTVAVHDPLSLDVLVERAARRGDLAIEREVAPVAEFVGRLAVRRLVGSRVLGVGLALERDGTPLGRGDLLVRAGGSASGQKRGA